MRRRAVKPPRTSSKNQTKQLIWRVLNDTDDPLYKIFLSFITLLILASVGLLFVETFVDLSPGTVETFHLIDDAILVTKAVMAEASALVLGGFALRVDASDPVHYPDRFMDEERGRDTWDTVMHSLKRVEALPGAGGGASHGRESCLSHERSVLP